MQGHNSYYRISSKKIELVTESVNELEKLLNKYFNDVNKVKPFYISGFLLSCIASENV